MSEYIVIHAEDYSTGKLGSSSFYDDSIEANAAAEEAAERSGGPYLVVQLRKLASYETVTEVRRTDLLKE